jgi:iron complex outermembrane receptor protein
MKVGTAAYLASVALAAVVGAARAQDTAGTEPALEEVLVTTDRGFGPSTVQAGSFRNAKVLDTPLTVNVISRQLLDVQAVEGLYDALRNTGGVTRSQLAGGTYDNIAIRGILVENRGNYRLNGSLPVINLIEQPLENKARVEVLKGAAALYYGFVPPSGVINMTTKRAGSSPVTEVTLRGDGHGTAIGALDLSRRLVDDRLGVRLNLAGGAVATGVDKVHGDRALAALALDFAVDERLRLALDYEYIAKDIPEPAAIALLAPVGGMIQLPDIPDPSQNLAGGWQRYDAHAQNILLRADYRLTDRWALKIEGGLAETIRDRSFSQFGNYNLTTGEGALRIFQTLGQKYENRNFRAEATGLVDTGPVTHELTFGWTYNEREQNGRQSRITNVAQNLYNPREIAELAAPANLTQSPSVITDQGAYILDRMVWEDFQLLAGVRWSNYESVAASTYTAENASPTAALIYKPLSNVSLYATYVEGLEEGGIAPANAVNAFEVLPPAESSQWEFGAKTEIEGLVASLAYFQITRPSAFRNGAGFFVLDGETEYRGIEFMAAGSIADDLSLIASGLWLDAEQVSAADPLVLGKRPENTPEYTASLFADWRLPFVQGLSLNAGAFYTGQRAVNAANQAFTGDVTTFSLGARYSSEIGGRLTTFQLNVENLTDKAYWNTAGNGLIGVGTPRTVKFKVTAAL